MREKISILEEIAAIKYAADKHELVILGYFHMY